MYGRDTDGADPVFTSGAYEPPLPDTVKPWSKLSTVYLKSGYLERSTGTDDDNLKASPPEEWLRNLVLEQRYDILSFLRLAIFLMQ